MSGIYFGEEVRLKSYSAVTKSGKSSLKIEVETGDHFVLAEILRQLDRIDAAQRAALANQKAKARNRLFKDTPSTFLWPFSERVALIEGVWDPQASTATDYVWFIWLLDTFEQSDAPRFMTVDHIRPGMKHLYSRMSDMDLATLSEAERRRQLRKTVASISPATAKTLFGEEV